MRICAYQCAGKLLETDANLSTMEAVAKACALQGASMVMFPELFLCGYNLGNDAMSVAETMDGKSIRRAGDIARENGIALLFGYAERAGSDVYNSAIFIGDTGDVLGNYRKVHLFGPEEKRIFKPGDQVRVIPFRGFKIGLLICYDIEFPEFVRSTVLAGADFLAVPTALTPEYGEVPTTIVRARAYENQIFVAYCDRIGVERDLTYLGMSGIVGPDGKDMARAGNADETILSADLDYDRYRQSITENTYIRDRRPDLYGPVTSVQ
jgi:nitrilase